MVYQKIAQRNPKTGVQKKIKKFLWGKSYMEIKVFGSMRVPLRILSKFAQTYSLTSRAFWLKKPCFARISKGSNPPRKISFRLLLPQKNRQMGYQKIAQRNPKTGVQKKNSKVFYGKNVIWKSRFLGQCGYPCEFFQNLHRHTPWQAEHFGWRNPTVHGCLRGQNPLEKLVFDFYSLKKIPIGKWGIKR